MHRAPRRRDGAGHLVVPEFVSEQCCESLLTAVERCRSRCPLPLVVRDDPGRPLRYVVIDGAVAARELPELAPLAEQVRSVAAATFDRPLVPFPDPRIAVNVNITPPGGEYRWHYDRNPVTGIVYLNAVAGGAIELCPSYRLPTLPGAAGETAAGLTLRRALDSVAAAGPLRRTLGRPLSVDPSPGTLVLMRGDRCLHRVQPVAGDHDRICAVFAYDDPSPAARRRPALDRYLYSGERCQASDPNYRH
ncbi:MAG: 2OG-Fe(II) oxygenase [Actinobacteria bacterium]|nr:2OG-Fe(II) oxygenase [Actinomycetota bacterium]